ncbi:sarcosine oxidase subunit gamma [Arthrobacter ginsengisoli]|uniref:Sarcosine oxidase subunit gamma n=1 Tax=Arthrobacter ginsengisoli TaxID=1356565 RepID=A0ABU1UIQ8_9MICC|nr:sarcosine oxidase subunit gamma family protein [Arthrobacter ginsengisoli]MDR7085079.1 sarcosine oxidase subunit gamma [Arthrobacter ginsengisoli]
MADTAASENSNQIRNARQSPASHLREAFVSGSAAGAVELREVPFLTMIGVRVDPQTEAGMRISSVTGGLPPKSGDVRGTGDTAVLWLGPEEFLVVAPTEVHESLGTDLIQRLLAALADGQGQVVDLSSNRTTFELSGPRSCAMLEKGCSLDLHPSVFKAGMALSTEIGGIPAVLWKTAEETYRIFPRASFAEFLGRWLLDAMREYASPEVP